MEVSSSLQAYYASVSPIRSLPRSFSVVPRVSLSSSCKSCLNLTSSFRVLRFKNRCCASSDTLIAASREDDVKVIEASSDESTDDLKSWMHSNGLPPCKVVLKERPSHDSKHRPIHYVAASEDLQAGDIAFSVPNSLVVTLERVLGNETVAELLASNKLSELACLALYLMYEKKQGKKSFWYPYIRELDRQRGRGQLAVESPLLWSENELSYLTGSPVLAEILGRSEGIKKEYNELDTVWFMAGSLFQQYPFDIPTEAFPFEIFKQAFVAIQSCVVHLQGVSLARRFALVPLGPPLLAYKGTCRAMLTAVGNAVQLVVDRPYKAGEPIVVWCGPQPNSRLLLNYGFVDEDNPYDRIVIEAALSTEDPLYQEKRMVAQRNGKLSIQAFQVHAGKEKAAVVDMLPYLRLGYVSDPSDMQSVITSQGPVCPIKENLLIKERTFIEKKVPSKREITRMLASHAGRQLKNNKEQPLKLQTAEKLKKVPCATKQHYHVSDYGRYAHSFPAKEPTTWSKQLTSKVFSAPCYLQNRHISSGEIPRQKKASPNSPFYTRRGYSTETQQDYNTQTNESLSVL